MAEGQVAFPFLVASTLSIEKITVTEFIPQLSLPQGTVCESLIFFFVIL